MIKLSKIKLKFLSVVLISAGLILVLTSLTLSLMELKPRKTLWRFQSIDTMKYSRDLAREKINDSAFNQIIATQVKNIASTGATHIAIATPYDEEFLPFLRKWVDAARRENLKIWFRGNFSGWEEWFSYSKITRQQHIYLTVNFIKENKDLFQDGDVFTSCPECENGGEGDPRQGNDVAGYRNFLISEYNQTKKAFLEINKKVTSNFYSMNYDVATLVMDEKTTKALDGVVTIDHYVSTPEKLNSDVDEVANKSKGRIVLGEFGVPIPDINGKMSEIEQSEWILRALKLMSTNKNVVGINYWVNVGGSTAIWDDGGKSFAAVNSLKNFYSSKQ